MDPTTVSWLVGHPTPTIHNAAATTANLLPTVTDIHLLDVVLLCDNREQECRHGIVLPLLFVVVVEVEANAKSSGDDANYHGCNDIESSYHTTDTTLLGKR